MKRFSCPDSACDLFGKIMMSPEKFFLWHLRTKPRTTLISLVQKLGLNPNPYSENNEVLRKLILDASIVGDEKI
jgi:hypothetical protein